jgi:cytidylate kinase
VRSPTPHTINQMVDRQIRRWTHEKAERGAARYRPSVALSRLPGSSAAELGSLVAEYLEFGFFGREIVDQIARQGHVSRHLVEGLDERMRDAIERFVRDGFSRLPHYTESQYHTELLRVLGTLSNRGMSVILGRGAAFALPSESTLRVLVVESRVGRIERLSRAKGPGLEKASDRIDYEEDQRRRFVQYHFGLDPDDASNFDLVVNTEALGITAAAGLVHRAYFDRFPDASTSAKIDKVRARSATLTVTQGRSTRSGA